MSERVACVCESVYRWRRVREGGVFFLLLAQSSPFSPARRRSHSPSSGQRDPTVPTGNGPGPPDSGLVHLDVTRQSRIFGQACVVSESLYGCRVERDPGRGKT